MINPIFYRRQSTIFAVGTNKQSSPYFHHTKHQYLGEIVAGAIAIKARFKRKP